MSPSAKLAALLLIATSCLPSPLLAQPAPDDSAGESQYLDVPYSDPSGVRFDEGELVILGPDAQEACRHPLSPDTSPEQVHLFLQRDDVFACAGHAFWKLSASDRQPGRACGQVLWRDTLDGECSDLIPAEHGEPLVAVKSDGESPARTAPIGYGDVTSSPPLPILSPHRAKTARSAHRLVSDVIAAVDDGKLLERLMKWDGASPPELTSQERASAREALGRLAEFERHDPTNASAVFYHALLQRLLGEREAAEATLAPLFALDDHYAPDLLLLQHTQSSGLRLDDAWRERLFEAGFARALRRGYEPRQNHSLVSVMLWLGSALSPAERDAAVALTDVERSERAHLYAARLVRFAPNVEGAAMLYQALADQAATRGDAEAETRWLGLVAQSRSRGMAGISPEQVSRAGNLIYLVSAALVAFWLGLLFRLLRSGFDRLPATSPRWVRFNPLTRLTRGELLGLSVLPGVAYFAAVNASRIIVLIGAMAALPIELDDGSQGSREQLAHVQQRLSAEAPHEARLMAAVGLQQSGDFDAATKAYELVGEDARALNNLGIMAHERGDAARAQQLWQQAVTRDATLWEARYNLGEPVDLQRARDQKALAPQTKLLALPADDALAQLEIAHHAEHPLSADASATLGSLNGESELALSSQLARVELWVLYALFFALALAALLTRPAESEIRHEHKKSAPGWALTVLLPGASRRWSVFGPLLTTLFLSALFAALGLHATGGVSTNVLEAIATPAFDKYFGLSAPLHDAESDFWRSLAQSWWVILVANLVIIGLLEWRKPDPNSPFVTRRSDSAR